LRRYRSGLMTAVFFLSLYSAVVLYEVVGLTWLI
jgi:hypothetical protein